MPDREKVIKAVEEAFDLVHSDFIGTDDFNETEWEQNKADALALLKEQETRVLDWDEIKNYSVVWGEFRGVKDIYPLIVTLDTKGRPLSWNPNINVSDEFLLIVYDEEDRENTRCWNHEPSDEQRQAVKWDG